MPRFVFAPIVIGAIFFCAPRVLAQVNPAVTPPPGPVNPPVTGTPAPSPSATPTGAISPGATPGADQNAPSPSATPTLTPTASPTPVPIIVDPPRAGVVIGQTATLRVRGVFGTLVATLANPALADVGIDQNARTVTLAGRAEGNTVLTVRDDRGETRDVAVRVGYQAGAIADQTTVRITGNPASAAYIREAAVAAAVRAARTRPGATINVSTDAVGGARNLAVDNIGAVDVPMQIEGDGMFSVSGSTRVRLENTALPRIQPQRLLVSDFPETLKENGVLFTADLTAEQTQRFLYYHYNPANSPNRRIVLRAQNTGTQPALVQFIFGVAGPDGNEMAVGHAATMKFLTREAQNEGMVLTIPGNTTLTMVDQLMPPQTVVSGVLQLREVEGPPLHLALVAQDGNAPIDEPIAQTELLTSTVRHARGVYPVPEFLFEYTYDVGGPNLEIPIGQLPLPNLREGEALSGDYGVKQTATVTIVNHDDYPAPIAIYQNPRGGRATGTYLIDRTLVQSHAAPAYSKFKLAQYQIPPRSFLRVTVVTMPEGGSSYPVRLIFAPDDGSVAPGAPGSPIY